MKATKFTAKFICLIIGLIFAGSIYSIICGIAWIGNKDLFAEMQ